MVVELWPCLFIRLQLQIFQPSEGFRNNQVLRVELCQQPSTHIATCSPQWDRGENRKRKCEKSSVKIKTFGQVKDRMVMGKQQNKGCKGNGSLLPTSKGMPSWSPRKGHLGREKPSSPSSSIPSFAAEHDVIWHRISLWPIWASCPAVSPPTFLPTFSLLLLARGTVGETKKREGLDTVQALFSCSQSINWCATNTIWMTNPKRSTVGAAIRKMNIISKMTRHTRKEMKIARSY